MSGSVSPLGRLRGRTRAELTDRLRQAASALAERVGAGSLLNLTRAPYARILAPGQPLTAYALLGRMRVRGLPHALPSLDDPTAVASVVREHCPDEANAVLARAERIAAGRFDLMGYKELSFGHPIDWQSEPVAGLRAPLSHWSRVPYLDAGVVGDHKVVWELNRQQSLVTLGQAYALTGDERWAAKTVQYLDQWLDANPPKLGINWASSLEVAFRAISWLLALRFLCRSPTLTPGLYARLLESFHVHGRHLETYLSTYFSPNTHLTGEALGLFYLGTLLPELHEAGGWQKRGLEILEAQLQVQIHPDGVYFEQATQYHRYTTEFYTHLIILAEANNVALAPHVRPTLERLFEHLLYMSRPDGTIPLFGDDDGGRLVQLDSRKPDDVRALLATGAVLFQRPDFAFGARGDVSGMVWLLGAEGISSFKSLDPAPPEDLARAFPDGGYYVTRDAWTADSDWLTVDCGPHGVMNAGHAHADALAFELVVGGLPVFLDAGTYTYSGPERNEFRAGSAHNTVTVDGVSSSVPAPGAFQWKHIAGASAEAWHATSRAAFVSGTHNGFDRLPDPAGHERSILHLIGDYFIVRDRIESGGAHEIAIRFHCAPGLESCIRSGNTENSACAEIGRTGDEEAVLRLAMFGRAGTLSVGQGWVSRQYGAREGASVVTWNQRGTGTQEVVSFMLPRASSGDAFPVELDGVEGGRSFLFKRTAGSDLLILGDTTVVTWREIATDAEWLWLRRNLQGNVTEFVAVNASYARSGDDNLWVPSARQKWRQSGDPGAFGSIRPGSSNP